ncbi:hypothetical protein B0H15DRAFT_733548, partial [Mycena belliarum]
EFRVYGRLLAWESHIFRDMLPIPQPVEIGPSEGCPVVNMTDNSDDLCYFLKALFDYKSTRFFAPHPASTNVDIICGILRLSRKYQVDDLYNRALVHLSSGFT